MEVFTQIQPDELHDTLSAHNIAPVITNHIDDLLGEILQLACFFQGTGFRF